MDGEEKQERKAAVAVDWLELPEHIISLILNKFSSITDYARFGAVCVQWQSTLDEEDYTKSLPRQLPLLMIPTPPSYKKNKKIKNKKKNDNNSCSFYRVTDGKIFNRLQLTMPSDRYVRGSSHGWLITVDNDDICFSVQLMNPFLYPNTSTKEIKLPPLTAHPSEQNNPAYVNCSHLQKAVLSADPISNPKDVIVMAIFGGCTKLSFCKPGDEAWTPIQDHVWGLFQDVIYYQGKFYAVNQKGTVVVCNVEKRTTTTYARPPVNKHLHTKYLVVSAGELFQVHRIYVKGSNDQITKEFKVFRLLQRRKAHTDWKRVKELSKHAFFIGDNASMSISTSDFPGCKPNCIYYTDDYTYRDWRDETSDYPHDLGLFNLENGSLEKHYPTEAGIHLWLAPIWIEPTLPRFLTRSKSNLIDKKLDN